MIANAIRAFLLSIEIAGKESTLPFISSPIAKVNAEEHIRILRGRLRDIQRSTQYDW